MQICTKRTYFSAFKRKYSQYELKSNKLQSIRTNMTYFNVLVDNMAKIIGLLSIGCCTILLSIILLRLYYDVYYDIYYDFAMILLGLY